MNNKADLVSHVAAETSTTKAAAGQMAGAVFSAIADALTRNESVAIAGFGKFAVRSRVARQGGNPQTGEPVAVPASKVPSLAIAPQSSHIRLVKERSWRGGGRGNSTTRHHSCGHLRSHAWKLNPLARGYALYG